MKIALSFIVLTAVTVGVIDRVYAQAPNPTAPQNPVAPAVATPPTDPATLNVPSLKTPKLTKTDAKKLQKTEVTGVKSKDVHPTTVFDNKTKVPGEAQAGDPAAITSLQQALDLAFARNPAILTAIEKAVRSEQLVEQVKAAARPQISASVSYSRLANSQSGASGGSSGGSSGSSSPYQVGLQSTPPGSSPVTLSSSATTNSNTATTSTTTATTNSGSNTTSRAATVTRAPGDTTTGGGTTTTTGGGTTTTTTTTTGGSGGFGKADLNSSTARLTITQGIDIFGLVRTSVEIGDLEKALSRLEIARTRQETALNVRNSYYSVLRSQEFLKVDEAAVAQSEEQLRVTKAQQNAGVASEYDVLLAQTRLDNNKQALITARNQVIVSKSALANQIGIDPATPVTAESPAIPDLPDLDEAKLLDRAFAQRPEYLQADANILKATKNIRLIRRGLLPSLSASASGGYNFTQQSFGSEKTTGSVGLTFTVPLYDGGTTKAQVESSRSDERGAYIQKDQFVRGIKAEIQQSVVAVRDAYERLQTTAGTVKQATEALRLANVRYRAGVGTQLEINDAQTSLVQAQNNQVNAQFDYLGALAKLSRAVGTPE